MSAQASQRDASGRRTAHRKRDRTASLGEDCTVDRDPPPSRAKIERDRCRTVFDTEFDAGPVMRQRDLALGGKAPGVQGEIDRPADPARVEPPPHAIARHDRDRLIVLAQCTAISDPPEDRIIGDDRRRAA